MKEINDLVGFKNIKIVQESNFFKFSLDSILLPNFVTLRKNDNMILDLCTGNIPVPLVLTTRTDSKIYGIELQNSIFELAKETIKLNSLESRIEVINDNVKNLDKYFSINSFDVITCNPPFFKYNDNCNINNNSVKAIARHEIEISLSEIINIVSKFLKNNGTFAIVHRTDRMIEIIELLKKYNLEPKKIQFVYPFINKESNIILIEAKKNGNTGLKVLNPLYIHNLDGSYTNEVKKYFE